MARVTEAILSGQAFATNANQGPMLDLTYGGQHGWAPNYKELVSNQAYVQRNLFAVLIEAPKFFQYMPNPEKWHQTLKALVEVHPQSIEGLNSALTVEVAEHPVGGAGEQQEEIANVTRNRSTITFNYVEKYGRPIQTFLEQWITTAMMDPDTKVPNIATLAEVPPDMLHDMYSMTVLFIEPDPTHKKPVKSWLTTNMFPKGTGDIIGRRDLTASGELLNLAIEMAGITQYGYGVNQFAQKILDNINLVGSNPYFKPSFVNEVESDVAAATSGFQDDIKEFNDRSIVK